MVVSTFERTCRISAFLQVIQNQAGSLELFRQPWFVLYYDLLALYKPAGGTGNVRMVGKEVNRGSTQQLPRWRC